MNKSSLWYYVKKMFPSTVVALLMFVLTWSWFGICVYSLWALSFVVAYITGKESPKEELKLSEDNREFIRKEAQKQWQYFVDFCNEDNNFLPPDNFQETPLGVVAQRTSPTNIGLAMLCTLSARDFGFITSIELYERLSKMVKSIEKMDKWNGHFYNWYSTVDLSLMRPAYVSTVDSGNFVAAANTLCEGLKEFVVEEQRLWDIISRLKALVNHMNFDVFLNKKNNLFYIGYDAERDSFGENCYDMLMSEARITSYIAVCTKQIPLKHWFNLARTLASKNGYVGITSWTGTMFEYFMPQIFLPSFSSSLIYESLKFALACQKERAARRGVPWGISESGFYSFDLALNYQYKAFGVQKLGLKMGLDKELVISPYSTFLALCLAPKDAIENLKKLSNLGMSGKYGFYEAIDFTNPKTENSAIVKSYMAHHEGMSLLMCTNAAFGNIVQKRFLKNKEYESGVELLQEKLPEYAIIHDNLRKYDNIPAHNRYRSQNETVTTQSYSLRNMKGYLLANDEYMALETDSGLNFSKYRKLLTARFSPRQKGNPKGKFILIKENNSGLIYGAAPAPLYRQDIQYETEFSDGNVVHSAISDNVKVKTVTAVDAILPLEFKELTLRNKKKNKDKIELLFYLEPVLSRYRDDLAHPLFSSLFIESFADTDKHTIYFRRRPRDTKKDELWFAVMTDGEFEEFSFETFKDKLVGRLETAKDLWMLFDRPFNGNIGAAIDPVLAIRMSVDLPAGELRHIRFIMTAGTSKQQCDDSLARGATEETNEIIKHSKGYTRSRKVLCKIEEEEEMLLYCLLPLLNFERYDRQEIINKNILGQQNLWKYGISGDLPIISLFLNDAEQAKKAIKYLHVHRYLAQRNMNFDLLFVFEEGGDYHRPIFSAVKDIIKDETDSAYLSALGGIHLVNLPVNDPCDKNLILAASVYVEDLSVIGARTDPSGGDDGTTAEVTKTAPLLEGSLVELDSDKVVVHNTGLSHRPWGVLLANRRFGTFMSDRAMNFTFDLNAREFKLSSWTNDLFAEAGENLYLEAEGKLYNLIAISSTFEFSKSKAVYHFNIGDISGIVQVTVSDKYACKIVEMSMTGKGKIKLVYEYDAVLGVDKRTAKYITCISGKDNLFLKNPFSAYFSAFEVFLVSDRQFRNAFEDGLFICECDVDLPGNATVKTRFAFGAVRNDAEYNLCIKETLGLDFNENSDKLKKEIENCVRNIHIKTPDSRLDFIVNEILCYQTLLSRVWGRTGFYQNGGAFGYRDQLQDLSNLAFMSPSLLYQHICRCAQHQFVEGDVQHWWHNLPTSPGKGHLGVRTRYSDDMLWLVYAVCEYINATGDLSILDREIEYITGKKLDDKEDEYCGIPDMSGVKENIYSHCLKSIYGAGKVGPNGILLIRGGDWNDSMNKVGDENSGESTWLSWFFAGVCTRFAKFAELRGDHKTAGELREFAASILMNIEKNCYDGEWYLRGFHKNGSKIGSKGDEECEIDLISQSFAAITSDSMMERKKSAMNAVYERLFDKDSNILKLFTPPFVNGEREVGYIRGYVAGIRENGGQYTHAAAWGAIAFFCLGDAERGMEVLKALNPLNRMDSMEEIKKYGCEPYVIAGDVYTNPDQYGRGGWTWYTGASGWVLRAVYAYLLGIKFEIGKLLIRPCVPKNWNEFQVDFYTQDTDVHIDARRAAAGEEEGSYINGARIEEPIALPGGKLHITVLF
ncbi:MAG: glucoamylase family protein [Bacillota bacterium]|nr:glucoamylase family protein [Bacillota bacterium]